MKIPQKKYFSFGDSNSDFLGTAQEWTDRNLAVHERVDFRFLVLPSRASTITEITEYMYFSPLKPRREFNHKCE